MSATMALLVFVGTWAAIGVVASLVMGRRGHDPVLWLLLGAALGPLVLAGVPAAVLDARETRPVVAQRGTVGPGPVKVLIGVDGSDASLHALEFVLQLLGPRVGLLEIATVIDYDTATSSGDEGHSEQVLATAAGKAATIAPCAPNTVVLPGKAGAALLEHARDGGFDLLAVGSRGRGMSKVVFGSVARTIAEAAVVPVVIVAPNAAAPEEASPAATDRERA